MLGGIARKLRIFGFDTLYVAHVADSEVLRIGLDQDRVILTADKEFFKRIVKAKARGVLVGGSDETQDLVHILRKTGGRASDGIGMESRCAACNGQLEPAGDVGAALPEKVAQIHAEIFRCAGCSKLYWEGSHIRRIRQLARTIDSRLKSQAD